MARLFNDIDDFKKYVAVTSNVEMESLAPSISYAIDRYILPALGEAQLNTLETAFNSNTGLAPLTYLLDKVQAALANFAIYEYLPMAEVQITESGVTRTEGTTTKTAYQNQVKTLRQTTLEKAYNYIEALYEFLEFNETSFPQWVSSEAYTKNKKLFINTARDFEKHYPITRGRETFRTLIPAMDDVENFYILPVLGQLFFDYLKGKIATKTTFPFKEKLALNLIQKATANFTIVEASQQGWVKFVSSGVVSQQQNTSSFEMEERSANNEQFSIKIRKANEIGLKYMDQLKKYLASEIDDFPIYRDDVSVNPIEEDDATDMRDYHNKRNKGGFFVV